MLYLGHYQWRTDPFPHWGQPEGCVGAIDLRSTVQRAQKVTPDGFGLFEIEGAVTIPKGFQVFGEDMEDSPTDLLKDRIATALGLAKVPAWVRCGDIVREILTLRCDPTGQSRVKGLMPGVDRRLHLHLGKWHASRPFAPGGVEEWPKIQEALHRQYRKAREASLSAETPSDHYLKVLDYWCDKFATRDWQQFVPDDLPKLEPVKHSTTITESFNTANSDTLGPDLTWTELAGDIDIVSNRAQGAANDSVARADSNLSSDDHYAQGTLHSVGGQLQGLIARKDGTATDTYYLAFNNSNTSWMTFSVVAGSFTEIGTSTSGVTVVAGDTLKLECNGSTITRYRNGASQNGVTDTDITGNLRCGLYINSGGIVDAFEAADLSAGATGNPWNYYAQAA